MNILIGNDDAPPTPLVVDVRVMSAMNSMNGSRDNDMAIPDYQGSGLSGPARVGNELRGVRERLGWKLPDLAARLKIRLPFLEAIEAGDLAALPAPAYAAGFIRSYAETMGLDPEEILRRFRAEGMTKPKQPHLTFPEPVPDRAVPPGAIVFLVAVIGIGAYFLWYRHSEHELKMAQMVPAVPARLAPLAVPKPPVPKPASKPVVLTPTPAATQAAPPSAMASAATPALAPVSSASPQPPSAPAASPPTGAATTGTSSVASPPLPGSSALATASTSPSPTSPTSPDQTASAAATTARNPLVISATANSWVQVQGPTGTILFSRVLKAGDTWPVPDEPGLTLTTGNAGGTVLVHNGVAGTPLGSDGAVIRKIPLTPAAPAAAAGPPPASGTAPPQSAATPAP
ncbi:helix-turn-helix domain-containing protein [Acidiphilium sp.]|uniref:helix-turn-helix domain-containing protein n=1 Tax=Acidiphilium sp. TaxID=527 RepID=UPI003CFC41B6